MINFLFLSGTKAIYVCDFVRKTLFLENPTNLLLSYRFRFIGCEALCIRVRDSRNTDSQSTNEDVCILTSLNFISLSLFLFLPSYFYLFFYLFIFFDLFFFLFPLYVVLHDFRFFRAPMHVTLAIFRTEMYEREREGIQFNPIEKRYDRILQKNLNRMILLAVELRIVAAR